MEPHRHPARMHGWMLYDRSEVSMTIDAKERESVADDDKQQTNRTARLLSLQSDASLMRKTLFSSRLAQRAEQIEMRCWVSEG